MMVVNQLFTGHSLYLIDRLVVFSKISPGQQVLDVACSTGWATVTAVRRVGDRGWVIGIVVVSKALYQARKKTPSDGLSSVGYRFRQPPITGQAFI